MNVDLISEFLLDREKRVAHQGELLKKNKDKTLVTVRINYPGIEKSNYITDDIVNIIHSEILTYYEKYIVYNDKYKNREGMICHLLFDLDFIVVKNLMIEIEENHILGRCLDIDVYRIKDNKVMGISRSDLFKSPRKCFICDLDAKICSRSQTHSIEEIKKYFEKAYFRYKEQEKKSEKLGYEISQKALKAMISEVSTFPSFGLVSPISTGSHNDMDYYTFLNSAIAITPYLKDMLKIGYSYQNPKYIFDAIRSLGKICENKMFEATKNVNTHKGMIFLMGVTIASIGKVIYEKKNFEGINIIIKNMVEDILDDFKDLDKKEQLTHGEKLYLEYGFTGIRGQVKNGLAVLFDNIIEKYANSNLKENDLYTQILLELMSIVEDSTIVYRHDINTLKKVQNDAKSILNIGGVYTKKGKKKCNELEKVYIKERISPGGCADLLAVSILLIDIKNSHILN